MVSLDVRVAPRGIFLSLGPSRERGTSRCTGAKLAIAISRGCGPWLPLRRCFPRSTFGLSKTTLAGLFPPSLLSSSFCPLAPTPSPHFFLFPYVFFFFPLPRFFPALLPDFWNAFFFDAPFRIVPFLTPFSTPARRSSLSN